jgi:hypothetical protein
MGVQDIEGIDRQDDQDSGEVQRFLKHLISDKKFHQKVLISIGKEQNVLRRPESLVTKL